MNSKNNEWYCTESECPVCGKTFISTAMHVYRDRRSPYGKVCSWSCVLESERLKEAAQKRKSRKRVKTHGKSL